MILPIKSNLISYERKTIHLMDFLFFFCSLFFSFVYSLFQHRLDVYVDSLLTLMHSHHTLIRVREEKCVKISYLLIAKHIHKISYGFYTLSSFPKTSKIFFFFFVGRINIFHRMKEFGKEIFDDFDIIEYPHTVLLLKRFFSFYLFL